MSALALALVGVGAGVSVPGSLAAHDTAVEQPPAAGFTILVTNDDGVDAPGLVALVEALRSLARVVVAAPVKGQSGTGNTLPSPRQAINVATRSDTAGVTWHAIDATPTACVLLAINSLMARPPDLVLSGINPGPNVGQAVYDSGTVGATRAAVWQGVPAISVSTSGGREQFGHVATFTRRLVERLQTEALIEPGLFLKISWPRGEPKGLRITRVSDRYHVLSFAPCPGTHTASCFNLRRELPTDPDLDTDTGAIRQGYVSLTPLRLDVTAPGPHDALKVLETSWERLLGR